MGVQALFHPPRGVLFTLPSRYSCTIGGQGYSSLGGWSPLLPTGFLVSRGTQDHCPECPPSGPPTGLSPPAVARSSAFGPPTVRIPQSDNVLQPRPGRTHDGLGCDPFRSPLLRVSRLISPPRGTEMFQFPRCPPDSLYIQLPVRTLPRSRVAPFGFGRLIARLQLPVHVSPRAASFFGPWPLGIHPTPLLAWHVPAHILGVRTPLSRIPSTQCRHVSR